MEVGAFKEQLNALEDNQWQQLTDGNSLVFTQDAGLQIERPDHPANLIKSIQALENPSIGLRQQVLEHAESILEIYFTSHPLTANDFKRQVEQLIQQFSASSFMAIYPNTADCTIFVEAGLVVAEQSDSPRHRYGIFLQLDTKAAGQDDERLLQLWLESGQAYQEYLSSNCCRYSCR